MKGKLVFIPTPIGNLKDITYRAIEEIELCDYLYSEDTRQSQKLLKHYNINKKLESINKINEHRIVDRVIEKLKAGAKVGYMSDAGTPLISDPGNILVTKSIENNIEIETLPGATAFVPALVNSGFDLSSFVYLGFPPHKKGRKTFIINLLKINHTVVIYESVHRIEKLLSELITYDIKERKISISRELSKLYEQTIRGTAEYLLEHFEKNPPRGEFVVVIESL